MKRVVGVVVYEDVISASLANPNVPKHIELSTIADVFEDDYHVSYAIIPDDFEERMNALYNNCWRLRTADNGIFVPVPESLKDYYIEEVRNEM